MEDYFYEFVVMVWMCTMAINCVLGFWIYSGLKDIEKTIDRINSPAHRDAPESTTPNPERK